MLFPRILEPGDDQRTLLRRDRGDVAGRHGMAAPGLQVDLAAVLGDAGVAFRA